MRGFILNETALAWRSISSAPSLDGYFLHNDNANRSEDSGWFNSNQDKVLCETISKVKLFQLTLHNSAQIPGRLLGVPGYGGKVFRRPFLSPLDHPRRGWEENLSVITRFWDFFKSYSMMTDLELDQTLHELDEILSKEEAKINRVESWKHRYVWELKKEP